MKGVLTEICQILPSSVLRPHHSTGSHASMILATSFATASAVILCRPANIVVISMEGRGSPSAFLLTNLILDAILSHWACAFLNVIRSGLIALLSVFLWDASIS